MRYLVKVSERLQESIATDFEASGESFLHTFGRSQKFEKDKEKVHLKINITKSQDLKNSFLKCITF